MLETALVTVGNWRVGTTSSTDYAGCKLSVFTLDDRKPFGQQIQYAEKDVHFDTQEMANTYCLCKGYLRIWKRNG